MTIDLDAIRGAIGYVHAPKLDEVFRLARLGQQREQERRAELGRLLTVVVGASSTIPRDGDSAIVAVQTALGDVLSFVSSLTAPPWTSDAPTVTGWYWVDRGDNNPRVFEVSVQDGRAKANVFGTWLSWEFCVEEECFRQWSGPLPEPPEGESDG